MQHRLLLASLALLVSLSSGCADLPAPGAAEIISLPPYPSRQDLIEYTVSAQNDNRFLVDVASIDVDPDRDIQLTLVARSPGGAETVTREAIRCQTAEYRILAIGRQDKAWKQVQEPRWRKIEEGTLNRQRAALALEYLCEGPTSVVDSAAAVAALTDPRHLQHGIGMDP